MVRLQYHKLFFLSSALLHLCRQSMSMNIIVYNYENTPVIGAKSSIFMSCLFFLTSRRLAQCNIHIISNIRGEMDTLNTAWSDHNIVSTHIHTHTEHWHQRAVPGHCPPLNHRQLAERGRVMDGLQYYCLPWQCLQPTPHPRV